MDKKLHFNSRPVQSLLLLLSAAAALGLYAAPSTIWTLCLLGVFCLVLFHAVLHWKDQAIKIEYRPGGLILSLSLALSGWIFSRDKSLLGAEGPAALVLPLLLVLAGAYAFYQLGCLLEENLLRLLKLPARRETAFPPSNLLFPVSMLGFFLLEPVWTVPVLISIILGIALALVTVLHSPELLTLPHRKGIPLFSLLTALGISLFRLRQADLGLFGWAAGVLSLPFLYVCLAVFYDWLIDRFDAIGLLREMTRRELILYLGMFLLAVLITAAVFLNTDGFYGTAHEFDVIYTSDSPKLVQTNAYLALRHQENDLRQPLFAVFAAPFLGLPYLLGCFFPQAPVLQVLLMDWVQILLLLLTNLMLAAKMELSARQRGLFMLLTCLSYPVLLYLFMMEQYIIVYFYLILCICLLPAKKQQAELPLCGAGGTLLTGLILLPALGTSHPVKEFKLWFSQMLTLCLSFLLLLLFFGRADILLNAPTQLLTMLQFSGEKLTVLQKLHQYSGFFSQCLLAPAAGADLNLMGYPSWQLVIPRGFSLGGVTVLTLCLISLVKNRKDPISQMAGAWLGFSFVILFLLGWGTAENGLVLYTLYFGWAVWVLLFRLLQTIGSRIPRFLCIAGGLGILTLLAVNVPAMISLIRFALLYYPI